MGISRQTATKWWGRYQEFGFDGLLESTSRPQHSPTAITDDVVDLILKMRAEKKWGAQRLAAELARLGVDVSPSTVHRTLTRHGVNNVALMDRPTGNSKREINRYDFDNIGDMVHVDVKKAGRIPDGGGWFIHGYGTDLHRKSKRVETTGKGGRVGYIYIHSAVDARSRLAYSEVHLNEKGTTAAGHWLRAVEFYRNYGFERFVRCMTDNGGAYRSRIFNQALELTGTGHRFTPPYTPRVNGKVEAFNKILNNEWLHVTGYDSEAARIAALSDFLNYYNHERPHSAVGYQPPVTRTLGTDFRLPPQPMLWPETSLPEVTADLTLFDV